MSVRRDKDDTNRPSSPPATEAEDGQALLPAEATMVDGGRPLFSMKLIEGGPHRPG